MKKNGEKINLVNDDDVINKKTCRPWNDGINLSQEKKVFRISNIFILLI